MLDRRVKTIPQGLKATGSNRFYRHATHPLGGFPVRVLLQSLCHLKFFRGLSRSFRRQGKCDCPRNTRFLACARKLLHGKLLPQPP